jgi:hypothetical protein
MAKDTRLAAEAYRLADEVRDGRWRHIDLRKPVSAYAELTEELQKRCPGFSLADYRKALAVGMFESR